MNEGGASRSRGLEGCCRMSAFARAEEESVAEDGSQDEETDADGKRDSA